MYANKKTFQNVEAYISAFPDEIQKVLKKIRSVIKKAAPSANERISYGMPFYEYGDKGRKCELIFFAAFKKHISLFIPPKKDLSIPDELKPYHVSKATYQFSINQSIPYNVIEKTVKMLVKANDGKKSHAVKKSDAVNTNISMEILAYNNKQSASDKEICDVLAEMISRELPEAENKIWHAHPVWFLEGNPVVGYSKQKPGIRLMFWSGADFDEAGLNVRDSKFKDASVFYNSASEMNKKDFKRWLKKSREIQWDYKNIVKRKGVLERLK